MKKFTAFKFLYPVTIILVGSAKKDLLEIHQIEKVIPALPHTVLEKLATLDYPIYMAKYPGLRASLRQGTEIELNNSTKKQGEKILEKLRFLDGLKSEVPFETIKAHEALEESLLILAIALRSKIDSSINSAGCDSSDFSQADALINLINTGFYEMPRSWYTGYELNPPM